jgi:2-isopropylmalate synthase
MTKKTSTSDGAAMADGLEPTKHRRIEIYDTTLRDGSQGDGVKFSVQDMLQVTLRLDDAGVDFVEGGFPLSNLRDEEFFHQARDLDLKHAQLVAFGVPRHKDKVAEQDAGLAALLEAETPVVCLVVKAAAVQVEQVLGTTPEEYIKLVDDSIRFLFKVRAEQKKPLRVFVDAEHAFDGYKANPTFVLALLRAARDAGADRLVLCDTNGGSLPDHVAAVTTEVQKTLVEGREGVALGIHTHNDGGLAVANTLAAVAQGAVQVQVTVNGFGERCGNADLVPVVGNLSLKLRYEVLRPGGLKRLTELSRFVYDRANLNYRSDQPFVGVSAFAHKGGMHVAAIQKDPAYYEHVPPEVVGNHRRVLVSDLSGRASVTEKLSRFGLKCDKETLLKIVDRVDELEKQGCQFDFADASFHLLALEMLGRRKRRFELEHYSVQFRDDGSGLPGSDEVVAWVKVKVGRDMRIQAREGCGPVHALDLALRAALEPTYPELATVRLAEYTVRVIAETDEPVCSGNTASPVRVFIRMQDEDGNVWGTVAVSHNIVSASYQALVDAFEYKSLLDSKKVWDPA